MSKEWRLSFKTHLERMAADYVDLYRIVANRTAKNLQWGFGGLVLSDDVRRPVES